MPSGRGTGMITEYRAACFLKMQGKEMKRKSVDGYGRALSDNQQQNVFTRSIAIGEVSARGFPHRW